MTLRRPRRPQLRTRVLAGVLLITVVALVAFDVAAVTALRGYLVGQTDSRLQTVLSMYRPVNQLVPVKARSQPPQVKMRSQPPPLASASTGEHLAGPAQARTNWVIAGPRLRLSPAVLAQYYVGFVTVHGRRGFVVGNPGLVPDLPPGWPVTAAGAHVQTVSSVGGATQLRVRSIGVPTPAGALVATTSLAAVNSTVRRLELILIIASAVAGLLVAAGVSWVMRRGLRPIETMAAQADRITAGDLTDRVSSQDPATEVGRLGAALNGMLTRIEAAISEREASQELTRRFFADASHELRTPLASLRANAELYQQGALARRPQVDEAMRRIALEAQRMSRLVDDMLRLARLDQHPDQQHDLVDLTALIHGCAERAQIADPQRTWRTQIAAGLVVTGDEELLRRAVDNLLANVCAHTPGGTVATITAAARGGTLTVEVSDDGPASRPTGSRTSSTGSTAPRRHRAPGPVSGWPSSPRSPPPTRATPRPRSTTRAGCVSPSRCPQAACPAPPRRSPPASSRAHAPPPRCSDAGPASSRNGLPPGRRTGQAGPYFVGVPGGAADNSVSFRL